MWANETSRAAGDSKSPSKDRMRGDTRQRGIPTLCHCCLQAQGPRQALLPLQFLQPLISETIYERHLVWRLHCQAVNEWETCSIRGQKQTLVAKHSALTPPSCFTAPGRTDAETFPRKQTRKNARTCNTNCFCKVSDLSLEPE